MSHPMWGDHEEPPHPDPENQEATCPACGKELGARGLPAHIATEHGGNNE